MLEVLLNFHDSIHQQSNPRDDERFHILGPEPFHWLRIVETSPRRRHFSAAEELRVINSVLFLYLPCADSGFGRRFIYLHCLSRCAVSYLCSLLH